MTSRNLNQAKPAISWKGGIKIYFAPKFSKHAFPLYSLRAGECALSIQKSSPRKSPVTGKTNRNEKLRANTRQPHTIRNGFFLRRRHGGWGSSFGLLPLSRPHSQQGASSGGSNTEEQRQDDTVNVLRVQQAQGTTALDRNRRVRTPTGTAPREKEKREKWSLSLMCV